MFTEDMRYCLTFGGATQFGMTLSRVECVQVYGTCVVTATIKEQNKPRWSHI